MLNITRPNSPNEPTQKISSSIPIGTVFSGEFHYLGNRYEGFFLKIPGHFITLDKSFMFWGASANSCHIPYINSYKEWPDAELIIRNHLRVV